MNQANQIATHYTKGTLLDDIRAALETIGKLENGLTVEDLAPVDEFHIGGRGATRHFLEQLALGPADHALEIGCGLGGASRFAAATYGVRVSGLDLTPEYIETGNELSRWVGLADQVSLQQGNALDLPFDEPTFSKGFMVHVGMNIPDKTALFQEIHRVLTPGGRFGVYDIMRNDEGPLNYPMPWATSADHSAVTPPEAYLDALQAAGFTIEAVNNRLDFARQFFADVQAQNAARGGPPPLGLHTLIGPTMPEKFKNMISAVNQGIIAPVEIIATK